MSQYDQTYETEDERKRRLRRLPRTPTLAELAAAAGINSKRESDAVQILKEEQKIRDRAKSALLARISNDVVERGQHLVAAGLVKVFHYEYYHHWSLYEMKKGIFSRKVREENDETRESVDMEGYED